MQLMTTHPDRRVCAVVNAALSRHRVQATFLSCSREKGHLHVLESNMLRSMRTTARRRQRISDVLKCSRHGEHTRVNLTDSRPGVTLWPSTVCVSCRAPSTNVGNVVLPLAVVGGGMLPRQRVGSCRCRVAGFDCERRLARLLIRDSHFLVPHADDPQPHTLTTHEPS
jgi:hypothetical protein